MAVADADASDTAADVPYRTRRPDALAVALEASEALPRGVRKAEAARVVEPSKAHAPAARLDADAAAAPEAPAVELANTRRKACTAAVASA